MPALVRLGWSSIHPHGDGIDAHLGPRDIEVDRDDVGRPNQQIVCEHRVDRSDPDVSASEHAGSGADLMLVHGP